MQQRNSKNVSRFPIPAGQNDQLNKRQSSAVHDNALSNTNSTFVLHENIVSPPWSFLVIEILVEFAGSTSLARLIGEQTIGHHPLVKFT